MEVSLPISNAPEVKNRHAAAREASVASRNTPRTAAGSAIPAASQTANTSATSLPLRFIVTGLLALVLGVAWLVAQPSVLASYHYNQYVIAVTHLFALGFLCTIVMGAMYQLVPVALETRLYSERLAKWQFAFHLVGFAGMVWMFWTWNMKQVGHFGSIMAVGVGLFVWNIAQTLRRVPKWNVTATAVSGALGWITLTIIAGLSIAAGKCAYESTSGLATATGVKSVVAGLRSLGAFMARFDQISAMHAHAHLSGVGFFTLLIVGVSYKLIPMFVLSEIQSHRRAVASVALLNLGLAGSFVTILLRSPWKLFFAGAIIAALVIYGFELRAILRARKRATLDWGIRSFLTAVGLLLPLSQLSLVLAWPGLPLNTFTGQLENLYGFLGLIGVVSFAVIGMLYKIIPFLVWFGVYSPHVGRAKLPALADLYSPRLQLAGYGSFLAGLAVTSTGILLSSERVVRLGSALLLVSVATLIINVVKMLRHFARPQISPIGLSKAQPTTV